MIDSRVDARRIIAILGPTGAGKSALAHEIALSKNCEIFSLDSLSVYKYIDIASAKPTKEEQMEVRYYGLDVLEPHQHCNAMLFLQLLESALKSDSTKPLLIVGGSSFFLKSIMDGLSAMPDSMEAHSKKLASIGDIEAQYDYLSRIDREYAANIARQDSYRIKKALLLYFATNLAPSAYFATHKRVPIGANIHLFALHKPTDVLREDIARRTKNMLESGIIDEVKYVLERYGANAPALRAIGTKECVSFLDGKIDRAELERQIFYHTCQLAKRQRTFNKTQFSNITLLESSDLKRAIYELL